MPTHEADAVKNVLRLGNDLAPVLRLRVFRIDSDQAVPRRGLIGAEVEFVADIADQGVIVFESVDDDAGLRVGIRQVLVGDREPVIGTDANGYDKMISVIGNFGIGSPIRLVRPGVDERICIL